jgi:hypothetical protein
VSDGVIAIAGQYFALQIDQASTLALVHDKALLPKPVTQRRSYRIEYTDGVATIVRRSTARIRSVVSGGK